MGIVHMSISAGLLVIAVTLIRAVALNKLPKTMFLVLWGVILIRLLVPVSIPIPFSAFSVVNEAILKVSESAQSVSFLPGTAALPSDRPAAAIQEMAALPGAIEPARNGTAIRFIWLAGMLAALAYFVFVFLKSHRKLRFALPIDNDGFLGAWLARHKLLRPIAIMQSDKVTSPLAVGIIRPKIILPKNMDLSDTQLLSHVLTHEYHHIKRGDALLKILLVLALCVHWFNPFVWVMFVLANRDLELTCDEIVVRHFGMEMKEAYAYSIIDIAEHRSAFAPFFSAFNKNAVEERIESIMKIKRASIPSWSIALVLATVLTAGTFSSVNAAPNAGHSIMARPMSVPEAREIALSMTEGGTVSIVELFPDTYRGFIYHIVVINDAARYEVFMDARTGDVFRFTAGKAPDMLALDIAWFGGDVVQPSLNRPRLDEAAAEALAMAGGGMVKHICLDWERGVSVYHVRVYRNGSRIDYHLDRSTLAVVGETTRRHNNASPSSSSFRRQQMDVMPTISFNEAGVIALAHMGGGIVREVSRSYIGDRPAFDVDITVNGQRWCFYIDIHTGQILRYYRE